MSKKKNKEHRHNRWGGSRTFTTSSLTRTRGEVISFVPELCFAVKFLLSQLLQQTLILVLLTRQGRPLLGKVCSTADAVTLMAWEKHTQKGKSLFWDFPYVSCPQVFSNLVTANNKGDLTWFWYLHCSCCALCSFYDDSCWVSCFGRPGWLVQRPCARPYKSLWWLWDQQDQACCWSFPVTPCQTVEVGSGGGWK